MSIFQHGYQQEVFDTMPPDKQVDSDGKQNSMVNWLWALISSVMNWLNVCNFTDYAGGTAYVNYNSGTTYNFGDKITYHKAVYESIADSNVGHAPDNSPDYWYKRQDSFVGADERIRYRDAKLVAEYALNKWFGGTFVQPTGTSDIYIVRNGYHKPSFTVGLTTGSAAGIRRSTAYVGLGFNTPVPYDFTIMFPTALYPAGGDQEVRQFFDTINSPENTYNIDTY